MKKIIIFVLILTTYYLILNTDAYAQSSLGLSAIPPRLEITVKPGETFTTTIKVRNESKLEKIISTDIKDFIVVNDSGTPIEIDSQDLPNRWAASDWVQISSDKLKLKPGETKSLNLTIIAPEDALPGGHYAMVLHSPSNDTFLSQTGAVIQTKVGTLIYITIPGDINESAKINNFSTKSFSEYGPIVFKSVITNFSDIHITPQTYINITNFLGLKVATLQLDNNINIFPYTSREFNSILNRKIMMGRFQAKLTATYGTTGQVATSTIFFWVIPYRLIIALVAIIIIVILLIKIKKVPPLPKIEQLEHELETLKKKYKDRS